jgi:hypothetical protein
VWANSSARALKERFALADAQAVLASLAELPISTWNYRAEGAAVRHMGPTAEDFYAAFGLGDDTASIGTIDADGVALAAIQGLVERVQAQDARIADLEARLAALEKSDGHPSSAGTARALPWLGATLIACGLFVAHGIRQSREELLP